MDRSALTARRLGLSVADRDNGSSTSTAMRQLDAARAAEAEIAPGHHSKHVSMKTFNFGSSRAMRLNSAFMSLKSADRSAGRTLAADEGRNRPMSYLHWMTAILGKTPSTPYPARDQGVRSRVLAGGTRVCGGTDGIGQEANQGKQDIWASAIWASRWRTNCSTTGTASRFTISTRRRCSRCCAQQ
jgi:hypothetical protein